MVKTKMIKTRMCLGCAKVGNDDNDNCMGGDEKSDDDFFFFLGCLEVFVERRYCSVCPIIHVLATVCHCYKMIVMMTLVTMTISL